jgi:hypothetical protein
VVTPKRLPSSVTAFPEDAEDLGRILESAGTEGDRHR